ncbi:hypothetical protein KIP88_43695, partial [Bradyrhizobium sp. SRL28]|uniref:hypothetical protein n=1 Tax=Bradyrhizobium sp. SRL28 TaxID=2836178 RepID=UPI001BDEC6C0
MFSDAATIARATGGTDEIQEQGPLWEEPSDVRSGSWLCENAKPLKDDRRSYSSKTALGHQLAIAFNFKIELKNVILVASRTF